MTTRHFKCDLCGSLDVIRVAVEEDSFSRRFQKCSHTEAAKIAVDKMKLRTDYGRPESATFEVSEVTLKEGEAVYGVAKRVIVELPFRPLDGEKLNELQIELLKDFPPKVASWIKSYAWEQGHSSGCDDVWGITQDIADGLGEALNG